MDIANYSSDSRAVIKVAREVATTFRHPEIDVEHLLIAVIRQEGTAVESILNQVDKSAAFIAHRFETYLKDQSSRSKPRENITISPGVEDVLTQAIEEKTRLYDPLVEPEHIFIAIFDPKSKLAPYVRDKIDLTKEGIYKAIAESKSVEEITAAADKKKAVGEAEPREKSAREVAGSLRYCIDLTNQAAAGQFDPCIGRDREIQQTIQILLRRRKNSPVLVGGAGVGKTAIVEGFAMAVVNKQVPKTLQDVRVLEVDMGAMVAGAKYKGEFEERFKALIGEVVKSGGKVILFIDEIHTITAAGSTGGGMDAANLIKPALARGQLRLIGATTEEEYIKYLEKDKALERRFEKVKIEQPSYESCVRIVKGVAPKYEEHHKIKFTEEAIAGSVKFAMRYLSERNLPDVALDVVDEAASQFATKKEYTEANFPVVEEHIKELEKLLADCEGKDPDKDKEIFGKLYDRYEAFSVSMGMLDDYWGYRVETMAKGGKE